MHDTSDGEMAASHLHHDFDHIEKLTLKDFREKYPDMILQNEISELKVKFYKKGDTIRRGYVQPSTNDHQDTLLEWVFER